MSWLKTIIRLLAGEAAEQDLRDDGADGPVATVSREFSETGYSMRTVRITRNGDGSGRLVTDGFECFTLENLALEIPAGTYQVNWEPSPRLGRDTYRLVRVPGRSGILVHPANFMHELLGCIALGFRLGAGPSIVRDEQDRGSKDAVTAFEDHMGRDSFMLVIA